MEPVSIFILSDSTGETGEQIVRSILGQFSFSHYQIKRFPNVLTIELLKNVLDQASATPNCIIFYTIVQQELIDYIKQDAQSHSYEEVDLLSSGMQTLQQMTGLSPKQEPGTIRKLDKQYFKRVEAIEFSVRYDDGQDPRGIKKADLVIIGVSRTSKTPLSMYLANKNIKVANVPLFPETEPPKELFELPASKIIGLTNGVEYLNNIRKERLKTLGLPPNATYAGMNRILDELQYAENIMKKIGCPIINVENKAIEETAEMILAYMKKSETKGFLNGYE